MAAGALALLLGGAGVVFFAIMLARAVGTPVSDPRALLGWALCLGVVALFGALGWMGLRRVIAGLRGRPARRARATANDGSTPRVAEQCSFCGASRRAVKAMVGGPAAALCDECLKAMLPIFAGDFDARGQVSAWCAHLLHGLPPRCPRAVSRPLIERVAGEDRSLEGVRSAVQWCFRTGNEPLARELLEAIPAAMRQASEWINLGLALSEEGRFEEALQATARAAGDDHLPWVLNNTAWYQAHLSPLASPEEWAVLQRQVERAQRLLAARRPVGWERIQPYFAGTEAELMRRAGDAAGALRRLEGVSGEGPWTGQHLIIRAQAELTLGRAAEARGALERAVDRLHPECRPAAQARQLLASLTPPVGDGE